MTELQAGVRVTYCSTRAQSTSPFAHAGLYHASLHCELVIQRVYGSELDSIENDCVF
jgi:hypothetical protein